MKSRFALHLIHFVTGSECRIACDIRENLLPKFSVVDNDIVTCRATGTSHHHTGRGSQVGGQSLF